MRKQALAVAGLLVVCATEIIAGPVGNYTTMYQPLYFDGPQSRPAIAASPRGDFAVTWAARGDDGTLDIFVSLSTEGEFGPSLGSAARVNTTTHGDQRNPAVAMNATGGFVVTWESDTQPGDPAPSVVYAQRFSANGLPVGEEFKVNLRVTQSHVTPVVAMDAVGNFVVAWIEFGVSNTLRSYAFLTNGDMRPGFIASNVAVHPPAIAMGAHGEYVIVWQTEDLQLAFKRVPANHDTNAAYLPVAAGSQIQRFPAVGTDAHGRFVIAWNDRDPSGGISLRARRFLSSGAHDGDVFQVNESTVVDADSRPSAAMDASGDFAIAWTQPWLPDSSGPRWYAQIYSRDGTRLSPEVEAPFSVMNHAMPAVAVDADGDAFVASIREGSTSELGVTRLTGPESVDLSILLQDDTDPAIPAGPVNLAFQVTNTHEPSVETGIPAIDTAIGLASAFNVQLTLEKLHVDFFDMPSNCRPFSGLIDVICRFEALEPQGVVSTVLPAEAESFGVAFTEATVYSDQFDEGPGPNSALETTSICEAGDSPGTIVFSDVPPSVAEGEVAQVEISRVDGSCGAVSVQYHTDSADFGALSWAHGDASPRVISITAVDDAVHGTAYPVGVYLHDPTGSAALASPSYVVIETTDNDPVPSVYIQFTDRSAEESTTVVARVRASHRSTSDMIVPLAWSGVAVLGEDLQAPTSVTIAAGNISADVIVALVDDGIEEPSEPATFTLGAPTNAVLGHDVEATITILPSCQAGPSQFVVRNPVASIAEGGAFALEVERIGGTCEEAWIHYDLGFTQDHEGRFAALYWSRLERGIRTIEVATVQDNIDEDPETVWLQLRDPVGASFDGTQPVLTIVDDDAEPTITISSELTDVTEGTGGLHLITFQLALTNPSERDPQVPFAVSGTADDFDYAIQQSPLRFFGTQRSMQINIRTDQFDEDDETIVIDFGEALRANWTGPRQIVITIRDDEEAPSVRVVTSDLTTAEDTVRSIALILSHPSENAITIPLVWSGSAVNGADFAAPTSVTVPAIPPAQSNPIRLTIPVTADGVDEDTETALLTLGAPTNAVLGSDVEFRLTITDIDPPPTVSFASAAQTTREGAGVTVPLVARLSAPSAKEIRIPLQADGTASRGTDYMAGDWLVIPAGATEGTAIVRIANNGIIELDEQVTFTMGTPVNADKGPVTAHTITIKDNDPEALGLRTTVDP